MKTKLIAILTANVIYGIAAIWLLLASHVTEVFLVLICGELREMNMRSSAPTVKKEENKP